MFHFPGFASAALCIQAGITGFSTRLGFPIRTSPDRSLVGGSPRLFAATRVLHRLLAPRHPSHALCSLQTSNFSPPPTRGRLEASSVSPSSHPLSRKCACFFRRLIRLRRPSRGSSPPSRPAKSYQSKLNSSSYSIFRDLTGAVCSLKSEQQAR